ncbi:GNAT family N-acetyltransferase [archaeon]|nr:MAG: GNAT family N-acetyltransferase [archaeon]
MGYALGRIESLPLDHLAHIAAPPSQPPSAYTGHVASIAVNPKFRGHGVAQQLMQELHRNIAVNYHVDSVTLYCRVS